MKQCCIVIPIYKDSLDCVEEISLNQLKKIIGKKWDCYLVYPEGLKLKSYTDIYPELKAVSFDKKYFESTAAYSQLCINYNFYKTFDNYEYMLIYQLDCYIFKDNISSWCNKKYDYIGGPIISTDCGWDTIKKVNDSKGIWRPFVGNGGFSLRNIEVFKDLTDPNGEVRQYYKLTDDLLSNVIYEDKYFCNDLYNYYDLYVPEWDEALSFAIDMSVDLVYEKICWKGEPMAIHAVDKNIRWWQHHIKEFNNPDIIEYCENKHKEFFKLYYNENNKTYREQ